MPVFIFDMDGTLTDTNHFWVDGGKHYIESLGLEAPEDYRKQMRTLGMRDYFAKLIEDHQLDITVEEIWNWHLTVNMPARYATAGPKQDIFAFLDKAKAAGIKMAVATATHHELCDPILKRLGLWDYFEFVYTNRQWNTNKTKPDLYLQCCKDLGADPSEAVIFEDALYAIRTATDAGLYTVGIAEETEYEVEQVKATADQYVVNYADIDWSKLPK